MINSLRRPRLLYVAPTLMVLLLMNVSSAHSVSQVVPASAVSPPAPKSIGLLGAPTSLSTLTLPSSLAAPNQIPVTKVVLVNSGNSTINSYSVATTLAQPIQSGTLMGVALTAANQRLNTSINSDLASESAQLQNLQIRQQLGVQALSIANQAPQAITSLFR